MALPSSGAISLSQVNTEIGASSTAQISLNDSAVRSLFGKASGAIAMSDGYGKANAFAFTVSSNTQNANLRTLALAAGWNGSSSVTATVASGVYLWSDSTATAGLIIDGSWPGGVALVNNGYIMGKGGVGAGYSGGSTTPAGTGGPAISLGVSCTITTSSGYIGGGGGGGGTYVGYKHGYTGGGGAGGGAGGALLSYSSYTGGVGGGIGQSGGNGTGGANVGLGGGAGGSGGAAVFYADNAGGGGGRIMPGVGGAAVSGGYGVSGAGGSGGNAATAPNPSYNTTNYVGTGGAGGGGGWGAAGSAVTNAGSAPPGTGGKAVALNGYSVTWVGGFPTGRVWGAVS